RERYNNDIDELNHEWWTTFWSHRYNNFEQVEPPYQNGETSIHGLNLDWKRFTTWSMTDFMNHEISSLKKHSTDIPVTSNFMRLYQGLDYHEMAKDVDIISWDIYPAWNNDYESVYQTAIGTAFEHTVMRSFKKDKPFILMESVTSQVNWHPFNKLKRPGIHKLSCMQAVACGADMIGYFQWRKGRGSYEQHHGAILDHLGTDDTRVFKDVVEVSDILEKLAPVQGSGVKTQAALIYDWNNRWAVEDMAGLSKNKNYEETCKREHAIFQKNGIDMDIISQDADLSGYKLIVLPMLYLIKPTFADRLKDFVAKGGVVVSTYLLGYVNENTLCYLGGFPGDGLKDVFGLYTEEIDSLYPSESNGVSFKNTISDDLYTIKDYCEIVKPTGADVIGTYTKDFYAGTPVVTVNTYGEGEAYYVGARIEDDGMEAIYQKAWKAAGLNVRPLPEGVEYHVRTCEGIDYEFYLNFTDKVQTITNVADGMNLLTDEKVVDEVSIQPYHLAVLEIKK
ncbi:MAG TPA: beta-galactosidase, partial [Epulopiscium sp.]|nr:beta-galactosidase [Candidatus Epulonipiscium sp.]